MSVSLNEFTTEQLQFAITLFREKTNDINLKIQELEDLPQCDVRLALTILYNDQFDTAILFRIQLENALNEVKDKDKIVSN